MNGSMEELGNEVSGCRKCRLWETRNKPLVGDGPVRAKTMVIGESPGYYEDLQGRAFIGEAGRVLDQLLDLANLTRDEIYITNVLKCHPPRNHNPTREEINACIGYLQRQIRIITPKLIITLGKYASREIFSMFNLEFTQISILHGRVLSAETAYGKMNIIPMYHPAVACYHSEMLDVLKQDFAKVGEML